MDRSERSWTSGEDTASSEQATDCKGIGILKGVETLLSILSGAVGRVPMVEVGPGVAGPDNEISRGAVGAWAADIEVVEWTAIFWPEIFSAIG